MCERQEAYIGLEHMLLAYMYEWGVPWGAKHTKLAIWHGENILL